MKQTRLDDLKDEVGMLPVEMRTEMGGLRAGFLATIAAILATAS